MQAANNEALSACNKRESCSSRSLLMGISCSKDVGEGLITNRAHGRAQVLGTGPLANDTFFIYALLIIQVVYAYLPNYLQGWRSAYCPRSRVGLDNPDRGRTLSTSLYTLNINQLQLKNIIRLI